MGRRIAHGLAIVLSVVSLGAAQRPISSESGTRPKVPKRVVLESRKRAGSAKPYQVGTASWYGSYFHGRPTASGEPYNMYDMTAAHRKLPLGTWVRVTNLRNGNWAILRVNDRGPYVAGRIIDVSYGAARMLEESGSGCAEKRPLRCPSHYRRFL